MRDKRVAERFLLGSAPTAPIRHLHRGIQRPRKFISRVTPVRLLLLFFRHLFFTRPLYFIVISGHGVRCVRPFFALKYLFTRTTRLVKSICSGQISSACWFIPDLHELSYPCSLLRKIISRTIPRSFVSRVFLAVGTSIFIYIYN